MIPKKLLLDFLRLLVQLLDFLITLVSSVKTVKKPDVIRFLGYVRVCIVRNNVERVTISIFSNNLIIILFYMEKKVLLDYLITLITNRYNFLRSPMGGIKNE